MGVPAPTDLSVGRGSHGRGALDISTQSMLAVVSTRSRVHWVKQNAPLKPRVSGNVDCKLMDTVSPQILAACLVLRLDERTTAALASSCRNAADACVPRLRAVRINLERKRALIRQAIALGGDSPYQGARACKAMAALARLLALRDCPSEHNTIRLTTSWIVGQDVTPHTLSAPFESVDAQRLDMARRIAEWQGWEQPPDPLILKFYIDTPTADTGRAFQRLRQWCGPWLARVHVVNLLPDKISNRAADDANVYGTGVTDVHVAMFTGATSLYVTDFEAVTGAFLYSLPALVHLSTTKCPNLRGQHVACAVLDGALTVVQSEPHVTEHLLRQKNVAHACVTSEQHLKLQISSQ